MAETDSEHSKLSIALGYATDVATAKQLLDQGADPNYYFVAPRHRGDHAFGDTAFGRVIKNAPLAVVQLLLDSKADPNLGNGMVNAAERDPQDTEWASIMELLLDRGADINAFQNQHNTDNKAYERVMNTLHPRGTALWLAISDGQAQRVKFLLEHGADPGIKSNRGGRFTSSLEMARAALETSEARDKTCAEQGVANNISDTLAQQACEELLRRWLERAVDEA